MRDDNDNENDDDNENDNDPARARRARSVCPVFPVLLRLDIYVGGTARIDSNHRRMGKTGQTDL